MTESMDKTELVVRTIAQTAIDNEKYFGDLDAVVGDGDFGYSLARGFEKVLEGWDGIDRADAGTFLKKTGMIVSSRIGGTSGPIWGTAFMRAGMTAGDKDLTGTDVVAMLRAAVEGIKTRGQSDVGDKTLLDALVPLTDTLEQQLQDGADAGTALAAAATAAKEAAEATKDLIAKHWPGPLTVICKIQPSLRMDLGDTDGTIALRVPDHDLARQRAAAPESR